MDQIKPLEPLILSPEEEEFARVLGSEIFNLLSDEYAAQLQRFTHLLPPGSSLPLRPTCISAALTKAAMTVQEYLQAIEG
jgi:hypothetical protein